MQFQLSPASDFHHCEYRHGSGIKAAQRADKCSSLSTAKLRYLAVFHNQSIVSCDAPVHFKVRYARSS